MTSSTPHAGPHGETHFDRSRITLTSQNFIAPQKQRNKGKQNPLQCAQNETRHSTHVTRQGIENTEPLPELQGIPLEIHMTGTRSLQTPQASSPPFFDLRLRERRFDPRLFALRLAERLAFLLPPFFAAAFLREERLFGAMVQTIRNYGCNTTASN